MSLNTYPYNPFPASTDKLDEAHNAELQQEVDQLKSGLTNLDNEVNGDATTYPYADVITIPDAVPANLADCNVKIEPVQSGSGVPSPDNVRPITGHTEASVEVTDGDETTKTYTIAFGDTIYGGTVDFDTGVMTVDRAIAEFDGSDDENWGSGTTYDDSRQYYITSWSDNNNAKVSGEVIANELTKGTTSQTNNTISIGNNLNIRVSQMTYADFTDWLDNSPLQICYELATPFTIQLTPQQIQLLKGTNTLTASTGQISVTVNGVSGAIGSVQTQANATDAALAELADKLPTAPTTDGAYVLTVTVADGTPTYSWESAS